MKCHSGSTKDAGPASFGAHTPTRFCSGGIDPKLSPASFSSHLILTGFMGTGKTTVGKIVASLLDLPFLDLDGVIKSKTGLSSNAYILRFKEKAFRKIEKICLRKILAGPVCVLATGGGAVLDKQNRQRMLSQGFVVWLTMPATLLLPRLKKSRTRPLLPEPLNQKKLKKMMDQRQPFYRRCHFSISAAARSPKELAILILNQYRKS